MKHDIPDCVKTHVPLSPLTTFKIGGIADYFADIDNEEDLRLVYEWASKVSLPVLVLGGGSNVVFADAGYRGLVVHLNFKEISSSVDNDYVHLSVGAGYDWDKLVAYTVDKGWWGLENLSAIPGTVGAAPIQNIGAYGVEVGGLIDSVRVYNVAEKSFQDFSASDCSFSYRNSIFKQEKGRYVVMAVTFKLSLSPNPVTHYPDVSRALVNIEQPSQKDVREAVATIRNCKFPDIRKVGTAGSFFMNPVVTDECFADLREKFSEINSHQVEGGVKVSAAWLIDHVAGARGERTGNVGTHDKQALVFINYGGATAKELELFADDISQIVFAKTGIKLQREVNFISEK